MKIFNVHDTDEKRGNLKLKIEDKSQNENLNENIGFLIKTCMKRIINFIKAYAYNNFRNFAFHTQLMIMFIPAFFILVFTLITAHIHEYEHILAPEYTNIYRSCFSDNSQFLIKFEEERIKDTMNNSFKNIIFIKIYSKELIMKNILDSELFLNETNYVDSNLDVLTDCHDMSYLFNYTIDFKSILHKTANPVIVNSYNQEKHNFNNNLIKSILLFSSLNFQNNCLQDLKQIYSYFAIISSGDNYQNKDYSYYPKIKDIYSNEINYDPFLEESNRFSIINHNFSNFQNKLSRLSMATSYEDIKILGVSFKEFYYSIMQVKIPHNGSFIILNTVSKYEMNISSEKNYEGYFFINLGNNNYTNFPSPEPYVDNYRVIGSPTTIPIAIPKIYHYYYRQIMISVNKFGRIFYNSDMFDFTQLNEIDKYYQFNFNIRTDCLPYDIAYLYNSFHLMTSDKNFVFDSSDLIKESILMAIPPNKTDGTETIKNICQSFNTTQYILYYYLLHWDVDCMGADQLKTYKIWNQLLFHEDEEFAYYYYDDYVSMPKCECLPFYCFDLNTSDNPIFEVRNIINSHVTGINPQYFSELAPHFIYADRMFLPTKCKASLLHYKVPIKTNSTSYTIDFKIDTNGLIFNPDMSYLSMFIISDDSDLFYFEGFSKELKYLILSLIKIYSALLICVTLFFTYFIYKKFQIIKNKIAEFIQNQRTHIFSLDKANRISLNLDQKIKNATKDNYDLTDYQERTSLCLKNNPLNSSNSLTEIICEDTNSKLVDTKFLERIKENKVLKTIKENEEIENDESCLIERNLFSAKKNQSLDDVRIEKFNESIVEKKNYDAKLFIEKSHEGKKEIELLQNDCIINELNVTINSDDSGCDNESHIDSRRNKNLINSDRNINSLITKRNSRKVWHPNHLGIMEFNHFRDVFKSCKLDELDKLLNLINMNSLLFKLDTDIDRNFYHEDITIKNFEKRSLNKIKYLKLFYPDSLNEDQDYERKQENSKSLLFEIISTEFSDFKNTSFNMTFKYLDNEEILSNPSITDHDLENSIILDDYIEKIDKNLKLFEKKNLSDYLSMYFESKIKEEIDAHENELLNISHINSSINYYLENILLKMLKKIYIEKIYKKD